MTWGIPTALFLQIPVIISLIGIASGFVVVYGLVAPAISNAFAALFGVRLNHTPMLPQRVLAALK
jgi:hypothetical protein